MSDDDGSRQSSFRGNTRNRREISGFVLHEVSYQPSVSIPLHRHTTAYASFVLEGSFKTQTAQAETYFREGALFYDPVGVTHANEFSPEGARVLCIEIPAPTSQRLESRGLNLSRGAIRTGGTAT